MVNKIYCFIASILFLGSCFAGHYQDANASNAVRYMSERVKIIRPENLIPPAEPEKTAKTVDSGSADVPPESIQSEFENLQKPEIEDQAGGREPEPKTVSKIKDTAELDEPEKAVEVMTEEMLREEISGIIGKEERFYSRKGRIDPFEPFLRQAEPDVPAEGQEKLNRRTPRTQLEKIDLSQLRLTAVLLSPAKTTAMVQESSGKGYVVYEGNYVGNKGGQVSKILKDRIIVEEKYLDIFGKVSVRERELKLQQ
jgi:Tfp pilus assembly protein PilP